MYPALSNYKQCWVNCTIHTQLKHASHQPWFSDKAESCFLSACSFFDPPTQGDTTLSSTWRSI